METTKIEAGKTVAEIQALLGSSQLVRATHAEYKDGKVVALGFVILVNGSDLPFRLPARIEPVFRHLQRRRSPSHRLRAADRDLEQAVRVAWRQILRWVQAQLALVECGMVDIAEVFLPYALLPDMRTTLWQKLQADPSRLLEGSR